MNTKAKAKKYFRGINFTLFSVSTVGVLPGVPFHRLLENYFLWILVEKRTVVRPSGVDLEGVPAILQEPHLNSTPGFA